MKAILEFDIDNPDDKMAHMRCVKALDMALALHEIAYNLHREFEDSGVIEEFRAKIFQELESHNINIDELIV